jgi:hypothetical protein
VGDLRQNRAIKVVVRHLVLEELFRCRDHSAIVREVQLDISGRVKPLPANGTVPDVPGSKNSSTEHSAGTARRR